MERLTKLNLARHAEHYATILDDLGYDDPADLINFNEERCKDFHYRCASAGVKVPHSCSLSVCNSCSLSVCNSCSKNQVNRELNS